MTTKMPMAMVVMVGGGGRLRSEGRHEGHHARNFRFLLQSLRESKGSFVARLLGGPIIPVMRYSEATRDDPWRKIISLNCFLGFSYIDGEAWFHLSPQIGITGIPRFY